MNKPKFLKIAAWSFSILAILFIVLVVHIYLVTKPVTYDNNDLQLSRIDFKQQVDSAEAAHIRSFVSHLPGVQNAMFNRQDNNLVYGYNTAKQNSENVFNLLLAYGHYRAERFVVPAAMAGSGCPMGKNKNSFVYKCSAVVYHWLN